MRHKVKGRKFGRIRKQRKAMLVSLAVSLILYEKITTTAAKAKEIRPIIDNLINLGKKNDLHSKREIAKVTQLKNVIEKLSEDLPKRLEKRESGYIQMTPISNRSGDNAKRIMLELLVTKKAIKEQSVSTTVKVAKKEKKEKIDEEKPKSIFGRVKDFATGTKKDVKTEVVVAPRTTSK